MVGPSGRATARGSARGREALPGEALTGPAPEGRDGETAGRREKSSRGARRRVGAGRR